MPSGWGLVPAIAPAGGGRWASARVRCGRVVVVGVLPEPAVEQNVVREPTEPARRELGQARWRGAAGDPGGEGLTDGK